MSKAGRAGASGVSAGTVAFLVTDIEESSRAWTAEHDAMAAAVERHNTIVDLALSTHGGVCSPAQRKGESVVAAFARPSDAVLAAHEAQSALMAVAWPTSVPLRVRMAIHVGEALVLEDGQYVGPAVIRAAKLGAIAHGGQVVVSAAARDVTADELGDRVAFRDLGEHQLRDLARPERVYQLQAPGLTDEFEPLRSLNARFHNLPVDLSTFVGRTSELAAVVGLLGSCRLVTITGVGGSGKASLRRPSLSICQIRRPSA